MECSKSQVVNGLCINKLPVGFRFHPTDEELLLHYLRRKVCNLPLPAIVIPESEVFRSNPWDLPVDSREKRYFFCKSKRNVRSKCSSRFSTDCGYWKPTGKDKQIMVPGTNIMIGIKKPFVFYQVNKSPGVKTQWIMHEFCLVCSITTPYLSQKVMVQMGDWVVCCVYQRKKKTRSHGAANDKLDCSKKSWTPRGFQGAGDHMNFLRTGDNNSRGILVAQNSVVSSCSSGITEVSSGSDLDEKAISSDI